MPKYKTLYLIKLVIKSLLIFPNKVLTNTNLTEL